MIGLALAGLGALAKAGTGIYQGIEANKIDKNNARPTQVVQSGYYDNVNDAQQMARLGLPQAQYNQAQQNIQRNQSAVLGQLGRSNNSGAGLQSLLRASNDADMNLDVKNAEARNNNMKYLAQQRGILGQQQNNAFDWNQKDKYLALAAKAQALRGAGQQNLMGAFGDVTQAGMMSQLTGSGASAGAASLAGIGSTPSVAGSFSGVNGLV